MLQRIHIEGYRSCKGVEIEGIGPITALVGRNGSGKTNILRGITRLAAMASSHDVSSLLERSAFDSSPLERYVADVQLNGNLYSYDLTLRLPEDSSDTGRTATLIERLALIHGPEHPEVLFSRHGQTLTIPGRPEPQTIEVGSMAPALTAVSALLPEGAGLLRHARPLLQFFRHTGYAAFVEPNEVSGGDIVSDDEFQAWMPRPRRSGGTPIIIMRLLDAAFNAGEKFDELRSLLGPAGLDLVGEIRIGSFDLPVNASRPREKPSRYHIIQFQPGGLLGGGDDLLFYRQLSLGTRRILRILAALILGDYHLILIEHPEDGIHPGLLKKVAGLLRDNADPMQIVLSSHSPDIFNSLRSEDVRLVTIQEGVTSARSLTPPQVRAAAQYIREEGTLAEFLAMTQEV